MKRHARRHVWKRLRAPAAAKKVPAAFEPPKYLASLIASINDGAKAAQTGALFFAFIGLYLLAVAFSTTDEDLLRERTIAISQLGMAVPVVFSFAVAPLIFVFLHIHTLIRYDMLAANLRQFDRELAGIADEEDRERCRHLLANVEFLRELAARPGTPLTSRLFRLMSWFVLAGFPLFVLTVVQLSGLRYQDQGIVWAQRGAIVADATAIVWFIRRKWWLWDGAGMLDFHHLLSRSLRRDFGFAILLGLLAFNFAWMGVPGPDAATVGHKAIETWREELRKAIGSEPERSRVLLSYGWEQPVDLLCLLRFGCRYLSVPHTLLMVVNPSAEVLARLRTAQGKASDSDIASLEGLNLRGRTLRFADLEDSRLYAAALTDGVDLRGADLSYAQLQGATLFGAQLQGAVLSSAQLQRAALNSARLQGAFLSYAQLQGANISDGKLQGAFLSYAQLQGATLFGAQLQGANISYAQLQGAGLSNAQLHGADLFHAQLQGANLIGDQLHGADLSYAQLQGATLSLAQLQGATLSLAQLQGADLSSAQLQGADVRGAKVWQTTFREEGDLSLSDLRSAQFEAPTERERAEVVASFDAIPNVAWGKEVAARVEDALTPQTPPWRGISGVAVHKFVLVGDLRDVRWGAIAQNKKTADEAEYDRALAPYLAKLAETDEFVAKGIAKRFPGGNFPDETERKRVLWPDLARRLLDGRKDGKITLPDDVAAELEPFILWGDWKRGAKLSKQRGLNPAGFR